MYGEYAAKTLMQLQRGRGRRKEAPSARYCLWQAVQHARCAGAAGGAAARHAGARALAHEVLLFLRGRAKGAGKWTGWREVATRATCRTPRRCAGTPGGAAASRAGARVAQETVCLAGADELQQRPCRSGRGQGNMMGPHARDRGCCTLHCQQRAGALGGAAASHAGASAWRTLPLTPSRAAGPGDRRRTE